MLSSTICKAHRLHRGIILAAAISLIVGCSNPSPPATAADPEGPGLAAAYTFGDFTDVDQVVDRAKNGKPNPGKPVLSLDQRGNEGKKVLTSNQHKFVGAILTGFINFPQAGTYQFSMRTNDGTQVDINGVTVLKDGEAHPDRDRGPEPVTVSEAGWKPIAIYFFQRKGSWALKLSWSGPGINGTVPVAPEFLKH